MRLRQSTKNGDWLLLDCYYDIYLLTPSNAEICPLNIIPLVKRVSQSPEEMEAIWESF